MTKKQKIEILNSIESHGFDYYFCFHTHKWEDGKTEISELAKNFREGRYKLQALVDKWDQELEDRD